MEWIIQATKKCTREELLEIGPLDVKQWLALKAYGDQDYNVHQGEQPIHTRSSTLEFAKKAVHFFILDRNIPRLGLLEAMGT